MGIYTYILVVISAQGQKAVLRELHSAHPGMTTMKSLARMYLWWPGLDKDIEESVHSCNECQLNQSNPPAAPLNPKVGHQNHGQESTWTTQVQSKAIIC